MKKTHSPSMHCAATSCLLLLLSVFCCSGSQEHRRNVEETNCHHTLGVANSGFFPVYWMYASDGRASHGRLHQRQAWRSDSPLYEDDGYIKQYAWLQVDLREPTLVTGVQVQGDPGEPAWVTWYRLWYSNNCEEFTPVLDGHKQPGKFQGSFDQNTVVTAFLHDIIITRCVRIIPIEITGNHSALRIELLGCNTGLCQEAIAPHMQSEEFEQTINIGNDTEALNFPKIPQTNLPTLTTIAFAEFKFHTEHVLFGVVFYLPPGKDKAEYRYVITYSRNCYTWEPVREKKGYGDALTFKVKRRRFETRQAAMPYPVRAHCIRVIPVADGKGNMADPTDIRANFIGCNTGQGIIHTCGLQKLVRAPVPARVYGDLAKRRRVKRVVGGQPTQAGQFPWLVSLQLIEDAEKNTHVCGASLVHPQWVLTAAHCINVMYTLDQDNGNYTRNFSAWQKPSFLSRLRVRIGEHSLDVEEGTHLDAEVEMVYPHPNYNVSYYINDIALVKLAEPIRLTDHVNTMCVTSSDQQFPAGTDCMVVGWGMTEDGFPARPHYVSVPLVDHEECQRNYSHLIISPDMLCAGAEEGHKDACVGDSGGPLMCQTGSQWFQVGVASWNIGCGRQSYPGVYSKVSLYIGWIIDLIAAN